MAEWSNWAGNVTANPTSIERPRTRDDVVELVTRAAERRGKVKPVGAGHSFTSIAAPVDVQVNLDAMSGLVAVDETTGRVRVQAGTHLYDLVELLAERGLALANMGDVDRQTIAGAVSTSTHGTGLGWTGFGGTVVGGEMVTGTGEVVRWSAPAEGASGPAGSGRGGAEQDGSGLSGSGQGGSQQSSAGENADLVPALGVTLGALGVLTEVELQCVPAFTLSAKEAPSTLTAEFASLDATLAETDHYEFFWFPHTDKVMTKRNTRGLGDAPVTPLPRWKSRLEDDLLSNTVFGWLNELAVRVPSLTPRINRISASTLSAREFSDRSHTVYASPRSVRFRESEMAVPLEAAEPILREMQRWVERTGEGVAFPVEVRWTAADDRWMSTATERESCYIAVHQYVKKDHHAYFEHFWAVAREHGARPHWGKMHHYDADYLRSVYPRFDDFLALRDRFDPQRVFANPYLEQVLGA